MASAPLEDKQTLVKEIMNIDPTLIGMTHPMVARCGEFVVDEEDEEGNIKSGHWEWFETALQLYTVFDLMKVRKIACLEKIPGS